MRPILRIAALSLAAAPLFAHAAGPDARGSDRVAFAPDALFAQIGRASETTAMTAGLQWNWNLAWRLGARAGHGPRRILGR